MLTIDLHRLRWWIRLLPLVRVGCIGDVGGRSGRHTDGGVHGASIGLGSIASVWDGVDGVGRVVDAARREADSEKLAQTRGCRVSAGSRCYVRNKMVDELKMEQE